MTVATALLYLLAVLVALAVPAVRARHRTRARRSAVVTLVDGTVLRGAIARRGRHVVLDDAELLDGPARRDFVRGATAIIGAEQVSCVRVVDTDPYAPHPTRATRPTARRPG